ncbi:MAG: hypothetical protein LBJ02_07005 [Bifidobacteriaceae bacterium]|jgi:predicted nucleic-acid-binding protein|nr:hypothetical protein [Bifidobacteriaceae bacterium]
MYRSAHEPKTWRSAAHPAYVNVIALVEAMWALRSAFWYPRSEIPSLVKRMLALDALRFEQARLVEQAAQAAEDGGFDFADTLIATLSQ